ncbi:hypothetical protein V6N12_065881 [Hibiscus sabdariffa]|uniref:Peptidase M20 dimerisation domain-containing protein n=1 Tax=Hibiscus sabdariffa TaxID=183260 RepID=A0ABR2AH29_9ROSI
MTTSNVKQALGDLNKESFVSLLTKIIGESKFLQNNPPELIPEEDRVVNHVLDCLRPYSTETGGGPLVINHVTYFPGRGNLIVEYPGTEPGKILSFVGMHMDVVTANPNDWDFDPFSLSIDGDKLRGRGTTDCLGHVALVTELMKRLAETKLKLKSTVVAVFIANEENSAISGVGVDALVKAGLLDKLKGGPLFWIDTADKQPCIGTGGMIPWKLHVTGKLFHSGLAHKAINALELGMEALKEIQIRFYKDFPPHPNEQVYGFATPSTMKPTQWSYPGGGINQIPGECTISGDVRLTPFYNVKDVMTKLQEYVDYINENISKLDTRGPVSKYILHDENIRGSLTLTFDEAMSGVACDLDSRGFHVLCKATEETVGHVKPYSITGSLPLIRELKDEGFDVQTSGYGLMATYHAKNEYCLLSDMCEVSFCCIFKMGDVAKDLASGTVGGAAQLIVGHPFDTIKVKLQSQPAPLPGQPPKFAGAMDAVKQTLAAEGPRGLYKGMGAPLATVAAFNAVLFTVRGQMEAFLRSEPGAPLTIKQQVIAGAGAGVAVSFLACPTELIKCRLQAQSALAVDTGSATVAVKYGGPMDVARQVLRSEGGARGLFKGLVPTLAREVPGNAAMFGVYEALKQYMAGGTDTSKLGRGSLIVAGGLAGASFWGSVYPTDVIKSVIQVDDYKNPKYKGSMHAFRSILATEGVKGLYKGFGPAMARSIPANAACFLAYEVTRSSLG